ncbi:MAG: tetratricopeptide repeat protein [Burkholderiales bacterium]|nr:MAG: tetratricopeptide repeat protein [Burkholderiales bacterium]
MSLRRSCLPRTPALAGVLLCAALLTGCAAPPQTRALAQDWPTGLPAAADLAHVPFVAQDDHLCGPASLSMVAQAAGLDLGMQELTPQVYLPGRQGALQVEMLAAARRNGLVPYRLPGRLPALLEQLAAGRPVLVLQNLAFETSPLWHYAVMVGYDRAAGEVVLHSGTTERQRMRLSVFERTWARGGHWAVLAVQPQDMPAGLDAQTWAEAVAALERVNPAAARRGWQALLGHSPGDRVALFGMGTTAHALSDPGAARDAFAEAVRLHPDFADAWHNLALVLLGQGRWQEAQDAIDRAVGIGGPRQPAHLALQQRIREARPALR